MSKIPINTLQAIQHKFHTLIRQRAGSLIDHLSSELPVLNQLLQSKEKKGWFPVTGMYGGFSYWFVGKGEHSMLVCESWSRVVEGSGKRHEITAKDVRLVEEGFA